MKKFNELREQYLEEKLKASDPAGTYIHDFVHSDNPKFAGKSKAKRIQMALAASYAAKEKSRNEDVELDEASYINGVKKDPESKVWKLTSMSHEDAVAKHGKENVRHMDAINRSGVKTGKKHVEVLSKLGEDVDQIDELSKSTLGSYVKKASQDAVIDRKIGADFENRASKARKPDMKNASTSLADRFKSKSRQRIRGVAKAVDRLSK